MVWLSLNFQNIFQKWTVRNKTGGKSNVHFLPRKSSCPLLGTPAKTGLILLFRHELEEVIQFKDADYAIQSWLDETQEAFPTNQFSKHPLWPRLKQTEKFSMSTGKSMENPTGKLFALKGRFCVIHTQMKKFKIPIIKFSRVFSSLTEVIGGVQWEAAISSCSTKCNPTVLHSQSWKYFPAGSWKQAMKSRTFKEQRVAYREARGIFESIFYYEAE